MNELVWFFAYTFALYFLGYIVGRANLKEDLARNTLSSAEGGES